MESHEAELATYYIIEFQGKRIKAYKHRNSQNMVNAEDCKTLYPFSECKILTKAE